MKRTVDTSWLIFGLALISLAIIAIIVSCQRETFLAPFQGPASGDAITGGGGTYALTLIAQPANTVSIIGGAGGTASLTAFAKNEAGYPMPDGTMVFWNATVGTVSPDFSTTTAGKATTVLTFLDEYAGCSVVTATSGETSASTTVCTQLVTPGPGTGATPTPTPTASSGAPTATPVQGATPTPTPVSPGTLTLTAASTVIEHGETTTLTAMVKTGQNAPESGVGVEFTVTSGGAFGILQCSGVIYTNTAGQATCDIKNENYTSNYQVVHVKAETEDGREDDEQLTMKP